VQASAGLGRSAFACQRQEHLASRPVSVSVATVSETPGGRIRRRGEPGFDAAVDALVWSARKPERRPAVVVHATSVEHVVDAVRLAQSESLQVKAIAGGHSWSASGIRRDAMLLDVSGLDGVSVDADRRTAVVGPGAHGGDLQQALKPHGLFFPGGHCPTVALGGFLLQGGWGWNFRALGPSCVSVEAIDVVTAAGDLLHCDATQHAEYLWAARGAGSGFFGVVTAFYLRCYDDPPLMLHTRHLYPAEAGGEVLKWALSLQDETPLDLEWHVVGSRPTRGAPPEYLVEATSFIADETAARDALAIIDRCPARASAIEWSEPQPTSFVQAVAGIDEIYRPGYRWTADNVWSDARSDAFADALAHAVEEVPESPGHVIMYGLPRYQLPDMALSLVGRFYVCALAAWENPREDGEWSSAPTRAMRLLEPFAKGMSLADENLAGRPAPVFTPANGARLEALREQLDPDARFCSFLMPPDA
jgi:FAD/FMN-containing dehydrogenase